MAGVLILDSGNYNNSALVQGLYFDVDIWVCNFPFLNGDIPLGTVTITQGSKYITANSGFESLMGCSLQNSNKPVYPFIAVHNGQVLEIDYVLSDTSAVLKQPCSYGNDTDSGYILNTLSPMPESYIKAVSSVCPAILVNTKFGPGTEFSLAAGPAKPLGSEPFLVNLPSVFDIILINQYS